MISELFEELVRGIVLLFGLMLFIIISLIIFSAYTYYNRPALSIEEMREQIEQYEQKQNALQKIPLKDRELLEIKS